MTVSTLKVFNQLIDIQADGDSGPCMKAINITIFCFKASPQSLVILLIYTFRVGMVARLLQLGGCMRRARRGSGTVKAAGEERRRSARRVEENIGSAWPGHHTPLLMDRLEQLCHCSS